MAWTAHSEFGGRVFTPRSAMRSALLGVLMLAALLFAMPQRAGAQTIIYVNAAAAPGGNGQSWGTAFDDLQLAIDAAIAIPLAQRDARIWVAAGTYTPTAERVLGDPQSASFVVPANTQLHGGFAGTESQLAERDWRAHPTTLSGDRLGNDGPAALGFANFGDNVYSVVVCPSSGGGFLSGFTITGGNAPGGAWGYGGGVLAETGSYIEDCDIIRNRADRGGGVAYLDGGSHTISRCRVMGNTAITLGGGIYLHPLGQYQYRLIVYTGVIAGNAASYGGGIYSGSPLYAEYTTLANNSATVEGGGASIGTPNDGAFTRFNASISWGNSAPSCRGVAYAGVPLQINWSVLDSVCGPWENQYPVTFANPVFLDPLGADGVLGTSDDDYHLGALSSAIDIGTSPGPPAYRLDCEGHWAPTDGNSDSVAANDAGAYEFNSAPYSPVLRVKTVGSGRQDGSTWNDAFGGLHAALDRASLYPGAFSQVWVAAGTYKPSTSLLQGGSRAASFQLQNGLAIYGGFAGNETELSQRDFVANETILSGDLNGDDNGDLNRSDNSLHVLRSTDGTVPPLIDGLTITGGNANGIGEDGIGGGLLGGDLRANQCTFANNTSTGTGGAGVGILGGEYDFTDCVWVFNTATNADPGRGGAVYAPVGSGRFERCLFEANSAFEGGGVYSGAAIFDECVFRANSALGPAGGLRASGGAVLYCRFWGNVAVGEGGGARAYNGLLIVGCEFVGNTTGGGTGGGLAAHAQVVNCTFASNRALTGLGSALDVSAMSSVHNCIAFFNEGSGVPVEHRQVLVASPAQSTVSHVITEGWANGYLGQGNNGLDPRFRRMPSPGADGVWGTIDDDYGDLRVTNGSPATDSGDSTVVPLDTYDIDGDGNTTESLPLDLDGLARFVDDPLVANMGVGTPPVDRGCYEFVPPVVTAPGDRRWVSPTGGSFNSVINWFPAVPGAQDNAVFDIPGVYTVDFAASPPVQTLTARFSRGVATLDLNGSTYSVTAAGEPALLVGDLPGAAASLTIADGTVAPFSARIGAEAGSIGMVTVTGPTGRLSIAQDDLSVGFFGQGHLVVENGGRVVSRTAGVGDQPGSEGSSALVTGAGSTWSIPFFLAINNGSVTVSDGGTLTAGFGVFLFQNGTISGDGTIDADVVNFGTIAPGNSPGTLTIEGSYEQVGIIPELGANSGRLLAQVAGPDAGDYDKLEVNGVATLGGGLFVEFMGGYTPQPNQLGEYPTFRLFESSSILTTRFDVAFFPPVPASQGTGKFLRAVYPNRGPGAVDLIIADLGTNPDFNDPDSFEILGGPTAAAVGDLNRDGLPDLAITLPDVEDPDNENGVLVILFNQGLDGNEQWLGFGGATQVNVEKFPSGVAIGDFDGIQGNDVVVTNMRSNTVSVIGQQAAEGNFANALTVATGNEPTAIISFNLDRAGRVDLAVAEGADNTVAMFANDNMSGTPGFTRTVTAPVGTRPSALRPYNPDNDKDLDVAVVNRGSSSLSVLPNLGFGTFAAAITIAVGDEPVGLIAAALLDRDEEDIREDLVVVNRGGGSVSVIVNTTPIDVTNNLSFAPAVESVLVTSDAEGSQPSSLAAVDMDDDGDRDVAVLARSTDNSGTVVRVLRNDLNGGEQLAFVESAELPAGLGPVAVLSADVDGDGRQDLITVNAQGPRGPGTGSVQTLRNALPPPPSACPADYDNNGQVQVSDIFSFLTAWFAGVPAAYSFGGTPGVPAIFAFLTAWFAGC